MAVIVQIQDDHTQTELKDVGVDDYINISLGELRWRAYLSEKSADLLEKTITEFLSGLEPSTVPERVASVRTPRAVGSGKSANALSVERKEQRQRIIQFAKGHPALKSVRIGDRGRIDSEVLAEFYTLHPEEPKLFGTK